MTQSANPEVVTKPTHWISYIIPAASQDSHSSMNMEEGAWASEKTCIMIQNTWYLHELQSQFAADAHTCPQRRQRWARCKPPRVTFLWDRQLYKYDRQINNEVCIRIQITWFTYLCLISRSNYKRMVFLLWCCNACFSIFVSSLFVPDAQVDVCAFILSLSERQSARTALRTF